MNGFPDFDPTKASGSSINITYPWSMKIKVTDSDLTCCKYESQSAFN